MLLQRLHRQISRISPFFGKGVLVIECCARFGRASRSVVETRLRFALPAEVEEPELEYPNRYPCRVL